MAVPRRHQDVGVSPGLDPRVGRDRVGTGVALVAVRVERHRDLGLGRRYDAERDPIAGVGTEVRVQVDRAADAGHPSRRMAVELGAGDVLAPRVVGREQRATGDAGTAPRVPAGDRPRCWWRHLRPPQVGRQDPFVVAAPGRGRRVDRVQRGDRGPGAGTARGQGGQQDAGTSRTPGAPHPDIMSVHCPDVGIPGLMVCRYAPGFTELVDSPGGFASSGRFVERQALMPPSQ